ncbi:MAG TPA: hypothetical protein VLP43_07210 [Solirubrobacteraceae bacterium]|nr:hypothetical protein [Solirubrobacteraceae bacterium]
MKAGVARRRSDILAGSGHPRTSPEDSAPFAASLAVTVTLAAAVFLAIMSIVLLVAHPPGTGSLATAVIIQNQRAKTALYIVAFAIVLPAALLTVPRLVDRIVARGGRQELPVLAAGLVASFALMLIAVKLSAALPWGDGLGTLLGGDAVWLLLATAALGRTASVGPVPGLSGLADARGPVAVVAGILVLGVVLSSTRLQGLSGVGLGLGGAAALIILAVQRLMDRYDRRLPLVRGPAGAAMDGVAIVLLLFAAVDVVVFQVSAGLPNSYFPPGVIQFQQDWILGPANQLLGGGAVLVNVPASQYGVGLLYFVAGSFHLAPIGYGTFGLLDGLLTALVYIAAYGVLRVAGVGRMLAAGAMALAVAVLLYNLPYSIGALPEEGPLRFGLPIIVVLATVVGARWPQRADAARRVALLALGVASLWALEAFVYTVLTWGAVVAVEAWGAAQERPQTPRRWLLGQAGRGIAAIVCAHLLLAGITLAVTGRLPEWQQYLAYLRALLLGGREGSITFGFSPWSPGLMVAAAEVASAAGIVLLVRRAPVLARARPAMLIALTGSTAYAIASFSYIDNRSSTYLLLYTSLPLLISAVLWLDLLLREASPPARAGGLGFVLGVSVLMLAAAWPAIGPRFSRSALAHAHPGGGLGVALRRLWHPPPIDPRAPEGERLVHHYLRGPRALILLPSAPDLAIEIAMRAQRASPLFVGDPSQDAFVSSVWRPRITAELARLRPGDRALVDDTALHDLLRLRRHGADYVLDHPLAGHSAQLDWILHGLDQRFRLVPIQAAGRGLVVVRFDRRR